MSEGISQLYLPLLISMHLKTDASSSSRYQMILRHNRVNCLNPEYGAIQGIILVRKQKGRVMTA